MKTCCFTGHRPQFFPWGNDLADPRSKSLLLELRKEIRRAIDDGFNTFMCGGALGVDTWAAQIVLELGQCLILALPWDSYNTKVSDPTYLAVKNSADKIVVVSDKRGVPGFTLRDHYMIDHSQRLIAVYDERSGIRSGTYRALEYARWKGIDIKQIRWIG